MFRQVILRDDHSPFAGVVLCGIWVINHDFSDVLFLFLYITTSLSGELSAFLEKGADHCFLVFIEDDGRSNGGS